MLAVLLVLAVLAVLLVLSNAHDVTPVSLRLAFWWLPPTTVPVAIVGALFVGAAIAGLPMLVANVLLRRRVAHLEQSAARTAPATVEDTQRIGSGHGA
ncbi:MAG: LapA family protein [Armatimonadota bacterium]|nr:LapA family protein [Armatimonadota bacterium]MDR5697503.1 LapA family protein [Armatimonadota bacterium]